MWLDKLVQRRLRFSVLVREEAMTFAVQTTCRRVLDFFRDHRIWQLTTMRLSEAATLGSTPRNFLPMLTRQLAPSSEKCPIQELVSKRTLTKLDPSLWPLNLKDVGRS